MMLIEQVAETGLYLLNSINPFRIEGQKTVAFEIAQQLSWKAPENIVLPVGNAGNISAVWKAFAEMKAHDVVSGIPRLIGVQAEGAAPFYNLFATKASSLQPIEQPATIATAIRIGNPVSWKKAIHAVRQSRGLVEKVSDEEILEAQYLLAKNEGICVEPASAAAIAGLAKLARLGEVARDESVVCITTGSGLKDAEAVVKSRAGRIVETGVDVSSLRSLLKQLSA